MLRTRDEIEADQLAKLNSLLSAVLSSNSFYRDKLDAALIDHPIESISDFRARVPFTTKQELVVDQLADPPYGTNLTYPLDSYSRFCQTSATTGAPLRWLDTADSWQWMIDSWKDVFRAANVSRDDTIMFAFSFGPFLGFWLAFEAGAQLGAVCLPAGGMSSAARLKMLLDTRATALCCTPTYALRLAEVARDEGIDLAQSSVRSIIVAGEAGGSIPATRRRIEELWPGASVCDHHGMTEVGPVTYRSPEAPGDLQIIESAYIAEAIEPGGPHAVGAGDEGELVLTTLGRTGSPLIRYRTGDLVRADFLAPPSPESMILRGGILARIDDMVTIRGVNVFPAAIEQIVRDIPEIVEYEVEVDTRPALAELRVVVEPAPSVDNPADPAERLESKLTELYSLRIPVSPAPPGSLPRYELKSRRWKRIE